MGLSKNVSPNGLITKNDAPTILHPQAVNYEWSLRLKDHLLGSNEGEGSQQEIETE